LKKSNFYSEIKKAKYDPVAGIKIAGLDTGADMNSFGTRMNRGTKVSCHFHSQGDEWYSILDGEGELFLADVNGTKLANHRSVPVNKGTVFCIPQKTAHQLRAHTQLDFIFICPDTHLGADRVVLPDLC
jgi:oxalate decarboxylase/phosphoglucose isomerase-like protein (cupin superfamily)